MGVAAKGKSRQRAFTDGVIVARVDHIVNDRSELSTTTAGVLVAMVGHIVKVKSEH